MEMAVILAMVIVDVKYWLINKCRNKSAFVDYNAMRFFSEIHLNG